MHDKLVEKNSLRFPVCILRSSDLLTLDLSTFRPFRNGCVDSSTSNRSFAAALQNCAGNLNSGKDSRPLYINLLAFLHPLQILPFTLSSFHTLTDISIAQDLCQFFKILTPLIFAGFLVAAGSHSVLHLSKN